MVSKSIVKSLAFSVSPEIVDNNIDPEKKTSSNLQSLCHPELLMRSEAICHSTQLLLHGKVGFTHSFCIPGMVAMA